MKWLRLLVAVVLVTGLLAAVPTGLPTAEAAPKLSVSPDKPIASERFKVSGKLSTKVVRPAQLQQKSGKKWVTVAKANTSSAGAFSFTTATKAKVTLRVVAPKAKVAGKTYKQVVTSSKAVSLASQSVSFTLPTSAYVNQSVVAKMTAKPARSGRAVSLQVKKSSSWVTVASGTQDKSGKATIRLVAATKGTYSYRVVSAAANGAGSKASGTKAITIKPDKVAVDDSARVLTSDESKKITSYTASNGTLVLTSAPTSAKTIAKGDVIPVPPRAGIESGALRKVTSVTRSGATTTVKTADANLPEIIENIPDAASQLGLSVVSSEFIPEDGVVTESVPGKSKDATGGLAAASVGELELKVAKSWKQGNASANVSGNVSIAPVVELELDVDWGGVKHYKFGAGVEAANKLTAAAAYTKKGEAKIPLGKLKQAMVGWIGPVPVWVEADFEIYVMLSASGSVSVSAELAQTGKSVAGIQNKSGNDLAPTSYLKNARATSQVVKAEASGKLSGFAGAGAELMVYSAAGPYTRLGATAEVSISGNITDGWTCSLVYGPIAEAGLRTSEAVKKLTGKQYTMATKTLVSPTTENGCPWDQPDPPTPPDPPNPPEPPTDPPASDSKTVAIAAGKEHTCALTSERTVYCWGDNWYGKLGRFTANAHQPNPLEVEGLTGVTSLTAGGDHTCAIADAEAYCWGSNRAGQLGDGTNVDQWGALVKVRGLTGVTSLTAGPDHTCAIADTGSYCWGSNENGQLGDGTNIDRWKPVKVLGLAGVTSLTAGNNHTCAIASTDTYCWGMNGAGQLGAGNSGGWSQRAGKVTGLTGVTSLTAGGYHTCAIASTGTYCWGANWSGQLGNGNIDGWPLPVKVAGLTGVTSLTAGGHHSCAIASTGTYCWGCDLNGQLGDGTFTERLAPVKVVGLP